MVTSDPASPMDDRVMRDASPQQATRSEERVTAAPEATEKEGGAICLVLDRAGSLDAESIYEATAGLAQAGLSFSAETFVAESRGTDELAPTLDALAARRECALVIVVGAGVGTGVESVAVVHPDQKFVIVGITGDEQPDAHPNVVGVVFREDQAGFLAGYAAAWAAAESQADCKVGVFGGVTFFAGTIINPTTVTGSDHPVDLGEPSREDEGFARGVEHYNRGAAQAVEVVGAYSADPSPDSAVGYAIAQDLIDAGAGVIFPVAGDAGLGVIEAVRDRKAAEDPCAGFAIGTDRDFADSVAPYGFPGDVVLTSSLKNLDRAIYNQVETYFTGTFSGGVDYEDLESGGVDIAEITSGDAGLSADLVRDLGAIREGIIDGSICTTILCGDE